MGKRAHTATTLQRQQMKILRLVPVVLSLVLVTACIQEAKWTWTGETSDGDVAGDGVTGDGKGEISPSDVPGGVDTDSAIPKDTTDTVEPKDLLDTVEPVDTVDTVEPLETVDTQDDCVPNCDGKDCGDDGCGGICGTCDNGNPCTDDSCDADQHCIHENNEASCSDEDPCTTGDICIGGNCVTVGILPCDDGNPCTTDTCVEGEGCTSIPIEDKTEPACDDGNPCTENVCISGECKNSLKDLAELVVEDCLCDEDDDCVPLEDDDLCNGTLVCDTEAEIPTCLVDEETIVTCTLTEGLAPECNVPVCNPETGDCSVDFINQNEPCSDGDACTWQDGCSEGNCIGISYSCDDPDQCEIALGATCNGDGTCTYETASMDGTPCNDGDECTTGEACQGGACVGGSAVSCDDGNGCTDDACDPLSGCTHTNNSANCSDDDPCTTNDHCDDGACVTFGTLDCEDGNECTDDSCVQGVGCDYVPGNEGGDCQNNTGICMSGTCCVTNCTSKDCGDDGCGGSCGTCGSGKACQNGQCVVTTWTDPTSDLTWQVTPTGGGMDWSEAKAHCAELSLDGGGWHLPTIGELRTLIRGCSSTVTGGACDVTDSCRSLSCWNIGDCGGCSGGGGPADGCYWPDEMQTCSYDWSSSPGEDVEDGAWSVYFGGGNIMNNPVNAAMYAHCVR